MKEVIELLDRMILERENAEYKQALIKAIELTILKLVKMEVSKLESFPHERVVKPQTTGGYVANLNNITDIHTIKLGDSKIKIVCDTTVPKDEFWFIDWDGRKQIVKY